MERSGSGGLIRREYAIPLGLFFLSLALNLYRINAQSLWANEVFSVVVGRSPFSEMTRLMAADILHPPLYYYLLHVWFNLFGVGALQARLLSAVFGTGSVLVMYFLAKYLFGPRTAAISALILAVSQLSVTYSQEARSYIALLFFVLCSIFSFLVALRKRGAGAWWTSVFFATLMIYTHYYGMIVAAILFLYALYRRKQDGLPARWLIGGVAFPLAALVPWLTSGVIQQALHNPKVVPGPQPFWFATHWWTIFSVMNRYNNGKLFGILGPTPWWTFLAGALLFTLPAILALRPLVRKSESSAPDRFRQEALVLLAALWLLPLMTILGLGFLGVQFSVRYVVFCAGPYYLLVGQGIAGLNSTLLRRTVIVLLLVFSVVSLRSIYFYPFKADYRSTLAYLAGEYREGDCCIFPGDDSVPPQWSLYWSIYQGDPARLRLTDIAAATSGRSDCQRVWLITYTPLESNVQEGEREKRLLEATHSKFEEKLYFWMEIGLYVPRK